MRDGNMFITLGMLAAFFAAVIYVLYATNRNAKGFEEYAVGGRSYGSWYVAFSYTNSWWPGSTFTAFMGLTVAAGVIGFYALAYASLGITAMYLMADRAWLWGKKFDLRTQPDLMGMRFDSKAVKIIASLIGIISLFPWVVLSAQGMGVIFRFATFNRWSVTTCLIVGLGLIAVRQYWTVRMGMRGLIMTDVLQGVVAYIVGGAVCIALLFGLFGSPASWSNIGNLPDELLTLPGDGGTYGPLYVTSLVLTGIIGSLCWPIAFQRIYTAAGVRSVKLGTVHTILLACGFYAVLTLLGLGIAGQEGFADDPQNAFYNVLGQYGGEWALGLALIILLAATMGHVDGAVQVAGAQIANDVVHTVKPQTDRQLTRIAKSSMVVYMVLAAIVAYYTFDFSRLQLLAQMSYQGIVQLAVPLFLGIFWKGGNKQGAVAGMVVGFGSAAVLTAVWPDDIPGLASVTGGVIALLLNLAAFMICHFVFKTSPAEKARVEAVFAAAKPVKRRAGGPEVVPAGAPTG
jgi:SSS family solute:Na+ symporter